MMNNIPFLVLRFFFENNILLLLRRSITIPTLILFILLIESKLIFIIDFFLFALNVANYPYYLYDIISSLITFCYVYKYLSIDHFIVWNRKSWAAITFSVHKHNKKWISSVISSLFFTTILSTPATTAFNPVIFLLMFTSITKVDCIRRISLLSTPLFWIWDLLQQRLAQ